MSDIQDLPARLADAGMDARVYWSVHAERERAHRKHDRLEHQSMERKPWTHPIWLPVLTEELGEVARVLCKDELGNEPDAREALRTECVQLAAMACAWVAAIDEAMGR